ncbi:MAG: YkoF family thiamine/hydroxymethylpyrimidine-binding protein [Bacteroidales bacterium]|nr:YkoF family thiamine/hydroxymethylpyrimidine-binding protein [Bacteroidales bacterium]
MDTSVEISMYPLSKAYEYLILDFLERINKYSNIIVETNGMSTQIFGDFETVFDALKNEIKIEFARNDKVVFVMKCLNMNAKIE